MSTSEKNRWDTSCHRGSRGIVRSRMRELQRRRPRSTEIGTIKSIFTFEQREHLVMSTGMTQLKVEM